MRSELIENSARQKASGASGPNNFVLSVATINGSGSQSANNILLKTLFRMGLPVGGKNLFPSNIAGLPTWFSIRVNASAYTANSSRTDIMIAMNPQTIAKDMAQVSSGGVFIYNQDLKVDPKSLRTDITNLSVPFREIMAGVESGIKLKKLLTNMAYVGVLGRLIRLNKDILLKTIADQFSGKSSVIELNITAVEAGWDFADKELSKVDFPFWVESLGLNQNKILIDGNSAAALGLLFGGCSFVSWYPITPSSSLVESFMRYADSYRKNSGGKNNFAVVQAEDELASICMVLGAGWTGARAMTATSGPGLSLMAEAAGYSYYTEIPAVIWDVQRVGPSTGMPTRTQQGDLASAAQLSHGDTRHIVLLPANPSECFEFGQTCFDLAERFQTLVIVLSDLDIGMNFWICDDFDYPTKPFDRGKVLNAEDLAQRPNYGRFVDVDGDGIPYRSLPGTHHPKSAYLTRGSGHTKMATYTEDPNEYQEVVDRIAKKLETAKSHVPAPIINWTKEKEIGIIAYGSSDIAVKEAMALLIDKYNIPTSYMRLRAFPFNSEVEDFIAAHKRIYVIDQNREGQMSQLLTRDFPNVAAKLCSIRHYNGQPITAENVANPIIEKEAN